MNDLPQLVRAPRASANDKVMRLVALHVGDGTSVAAGQLLCEVEGEKAVIEIDAPADGRFFAAAEVGQTVAVGDVIAVVATEGTDRDEALAAIGAPTPTDETPSPATDGARFSKAAASLAEQLGVGIAAFAGRGLVTETMVRAAVAEPVGDGPLPAEDRPENGRVLVIGAGSGAAQILSALLPDPGSEVVGLLDDDPAKRDFQVFGLGVLGPVAALADLAAAGMADSVIVATSHHPDFRRAVAAAAHKAGLRLANAIHPTAWFDEGVCLGGGSYIGPYCYLGAETRLGALCYLSSRTTFEHHNRVGDGVTTGPNVATSGQVMVGDGVRFGAGIVVEPGLIIGDGATIASGAVVTTDVTAGAVVKQRRRLPRGGSR